MALSYKARRRWSLFILLVGLPIYIVIAVSIVNMLDRPSVLIELLIYIVLGFAWALPFKFVFRGVGKARNWHRAGKLTTGTLHRLLANEHTFPHFQSFNSTQK